MPDSVGQVCLLDATALLRPSQWDLLSVVPLTRSQLVQLLHLVVIVTCHAKVMCHPPLGSYVEALAVSMCVLACL
jgi:hypothetical protein